MTRLSEPRTDGRPLLAVSALLAGGAILVLLSRLPFLVPGYGVDGDAWLTAEAAARIAATGRYWMSRVPGHPLQEYAYALIWNSGPFAFNFISAAAGVVSFAGFALAARRFGARDYLLAGLALVFVPVVYLASVTAMDYVWALAFMMLALYFVAAGRPVAAGVMLGLAAGCRATAVLFAAPYALMLPGPWRSARRAKELVALGAAAAIVAGLCYVPVWLAYRSGMPEVFDDPVAPFVILKKATVDVWGIVGFAALAIAGAAGAAWLLIRRGKHPTPELSAPFGRAVVAGWTLSALLALYLFIRLPHEAGYLIPALPFVLLLLARGLPRAVFVGLCVALIASPFLLGVYTPGRPNSPQPSRLAIEAPVGQKLVVDLALGPIFADHQARKAAAAYVDRVLAAGARLPDRSVVAAGNWLPWIILSRPSGQKAPEYVLWLTPAEVTDRLRAGWNVYYLAESEAQRVGDVRLPEDLADRRPVPLLR